MREAGGGKIRNKVPGTRGRWEPVAAIGLSAERNLSPSQRTDSARLRKQFWQNDGIENPRKLNRELSKFYKCVRTPQIPTTH